MSQIQKITTFSHINPVFTLFCRLFSYFSRLLARSCWVVLAVITVINIASTVKYHSLYYTGFPYIEIVQSLIASVLAFQVLYFMHQKAKLNNSGYFDDTHSAASSDPNIAYVTHGYDLAKSCHSADSFDNSTLESGKKRFLGIPPFKEWNLTVVTTVVVLIVATVSATYITMCQFYDLSDIKAIIKLASHYQTWFTGSNPNSVAHISHIEHDYIQKYPYQSGMVWFVWLMTMVIPGLEASSLPHIMTTLQYVMIPFICASIILIIRLAYRFSGDNSYVAKIAAMLCLFFPVLPVVSQEVYGYNISMPFILGAFLLAYKCYDALKGFDEPDFERFWCYFAGFVVLMIILGFVKPNNIIVGIALSMGLILAAVFSSKLFNKTLSARNSSSVENEASLADFTDSNNSTSSTGSNDSTNSTEDSVNSNNSSAVSTPSRRRKKSFFSRLFNSILFAIANISRRWFNSSARKNHETWSNINAVNRITVYFKPIFKRLKLNELTVSLSNGAIDRCNVSGNGFNSDFVRTNRGVRVFRKPVLAVENGLNVSIYESYKKHIASIVNNTTNNNSNNSGNDSNSGKNGVGGDSCSRKRLSARFSWSNIKSFVKTQIVKPAVLLVLTAIIVLPSMSLGSNIAQIGFTQVTGIDFPTNRRQKIAPFLAIGLGDKADGRMGYYNAQVSEFNIPVETINARGERILKTRLSDFANNPSEAIRFFVLKTVQTWGDPTFLFFENPPRLTFIHFQELKEKAEKREREKETKKTKNKESKNGVKNKPISMFENTPSLEFYAKNAANSMFGTVKHGVKFANYKTVNDSKSGGNAHIVKPVGMGIGNMSFNNNSWYTTSLLNPMNPISPLYPGNNMYSSNDDDDYCDYHDCRPHIDDDNENPVLSHNLKEFTISNARKLVWNDFSAFIYGFWCDIMASLIMLGTMIGFGVIMAKNKGNSYLNGKKWIILTPIIALFGGFLFHTVWETKPPYAFYYFIYIIPFAAIGLYYSKNANIGQILNWIFYKKGKKTEKEAKEEK